MIDDLIGYYQRELAFLREQAGAFAEAHPKIASRLRLNRETVEDPHVGRLIESVAFLNARLRHKLDDEFPELTDTLLLTLYPQLIQPLPSFFVARLQPDPALVAETTVPAGTVLLTEPVAGEPLRYRTCWPVRLLPLRIAGAGLGGLPLDAPALGLGQAKGVLRITLELTSPDADFGAMGLDRLRFYLRSDARRAQILLEQFGVNLLGIGVGAGPDDPRAVLLPPAALRLMGLGPDEMLLPQAANANGAYSAVQEHFAYPQKHLFLEVSGLAARTLTLDGDRLDLFFYLDRPSAELERVVRADDFELFATPALNLMPLVSEPIQLDGTRVDYRIVPDARREDALEVHSVAAVTIQRGTGEEVEAPPLHSLDRGTPRLGRFFHGLSRRSSFGGGGGDDLFVSIADLDGQLLADDNALVTVSLLAMNRDLPLRLPFGGGRPTLVLDKPMPGLSAVTVLTKPTPTRRPGRRRAAAWKLVGQLSINHLSMTGGDKGAAVLREMLALYDLSDTPESASLRERLVGVSAAPGVGRVRVGGHTALCSGTDLMLEVDDERLSGSGAFLLTAVLQRFLGSMCALNSFVRVSTRLRRETGVWKQWAPRVGDRDLL
jgi:type VI secretion system protein ImpG